MEAEKSAIQALPKTTVRLIGSAQVITSVVSVVKELVENSLDAGATTLDIKLENYGFDKIEVRDNGSGIKQSDTASMGLPHHTSKITDTEDLGRLYTYGFRGEALGSLCAVSRVTVTTKTTEDEVGMTYELGFDGAIMDKKPSHLGQGTTVTAVQLFHNVPVRRQYYTAAKRRKEELKKVEDLVIAYSVIKHDVRFTLRHNRDVVWQKTSMSSVRHSLLKVFGNSALSLMVHKQISHDDPKCDMELYIPRPDTDCHVMSRTSADRCFVFINGRPVTHKEFNKLLKQSYCERSGSESSRWPLSCLSVQVPPSTVDVNLEPNKTRVLLEHNTDILSVLGQLLEEVYGKKEDQLKLANGDPPTSVPQSIEQATEEEPASEAPPTSASVECNNVNGYCTTGEKGDLGKSQVQSDPHHNQNRERPNLTTTKDQDSLTPANVATPAKSSPSENTNPGLPITPELTLPLTKPLHNSTRCDGMISTQNVTFDLLKDFDATDDDFSDILADNLDITTPERVAEPSGRAPQCKEPQINKIANIENGKSETPTDPAMPSLNTDMMPTGSINTAGSTVIRQTSIDTGASGGNTSVSSKDVQSAQWSRGETLNDGTGQKVQPVQLLLPGASAVKPSDVSITYTKKPDDPSTPASRMKLAANSPGQMTLMDVTNSCHIKKPTTSFLFFSKEVRPTVLTENPGADFQTVAKLVAEKWKSLIPDQRDKYQQLANKDVTRYQEEVRTRKETGLPMTSMHSSKKRKLDKHNTVWDMLCSPVPPKPKPKKEKPFIRTSVTLEFSMNKLKSRLCTHPKPRSAEGDLLHMVGEVRPAGWWVGTDRDLLVGIIPWRLQETLIYSQLMENHSLPVNKLDEPLPLSPSVLGSEGLWEVLLSLPSLPSYSLDSTFSYLTDPRITRSGFSIRKTQENPPRVEAFTMTQVINTFGLPDLREILRSIKQSSTVSVTDCRPLKVKQYLQGEAVRMSRQMPQRVSSDEVLDLLKRLQKRNLSKTGKCFHHKPFLHTLYNMNDLPLSQGCTQTQTDMDT